MVECLKHCLHQLILRGYELLHLWVVVGIVGLIVVGLAIALAIPRVHHLSDFLRKGYKFSKIDPNRNYMLCFLLILIKRCDRG
jgi:hypothetical protein